MVEKEFDPYFAGTGNDDFATPFEPMNSVLDPEDSARPDGRVHNRKYYPKPKVVNKVIPPSDLKCIHCGKKFKTQAAYYGHQGSHVNNGRKKKLNSDKKLYKCKICGLKFTIKKNMKKHKLMVHNGNKFDKELQDLINQNFEEDDEINLKKDKKIYKEDKVNNVVEQSLINGNNSDVMSEDIEDILKEEEKRGKKLGEKYKNFHMRNNNNSSYVINNDKNEEENNNDSSDSDDEIVIDDEGEEGERESKDNNNNKDINNKLINNNINYNVNKNNENLKNNNNINSNNNNKEKDNSHVHIENNNNNNNDKKIN